VDSSQIVEASRELLRSSFEAPALTRFLGLIGASVDADRAYVFENEERGGRVLTHQRYEWNSGTAEPQIDNPELQNLDATALLPHWLENFHRGAPYFGVVRELPRADQEILGPQSILSILVCPIRSRTEVWGFVGFDDCRRERRWSSEEIRVLSQASTALAAALRHRDLQTRLSTARDALQRVLGGDER
jgi:GAF domain-containing protein